MKPEDAGQILDIYRHYIENTAVSFEEETPSPELFTKMVEAISGTYPYIVCEVGGKVIAYAYASKHRERSAYRFNAETSVYIREDFQGRSIGKALYTALLQILRLSGYVNLYAGITIPNNKSVALHKSMGFSETAMYRKTGYKFGEWVDVIWFEKRFEPMGDPVSPVSIGDISRELLEKILDEAAQIIK